MQSQGIRVLHGPTNARRELRALVRLALPAVLTQVAHMTMGVVDTLMVSRLGTEGLAASMLGSSWVFGTLILAMGVLFGLDPIISQAHGAGDGARAGLALQRGVMLGLVLSLPLAALWLCTGPVLRLAGQQLELAQAAHRYAAVQVFSIPFALAFTALRQYLTGRGIMTPALGVMWAANLINVLLNWVLIFGHLGVAPMGLVGAGIASGLSRVVMFGGLLAWTLLGRLQRGAWLPWSRRAFELRGLLEVLHYGGPVGLQLGLEVWGFHLVTLLAGVIGAQALAAHAIVLNLASLSFMLPLGVSIAAATRVGNLIGARDHAGAQLAARLSLAVGAGLMTLGAVVFVLFRWQLPLAWRPESEVLALAASILPVAAAFQVFDGLQVVGCGVLRGRGDTRPAAWFNLLGYYALGVPLGAWLAFGLERGLPGLWWGLVLGLASVAVLLIWRIEHRRNGPPTVTESAQG